MKIIDLYNKIANGEEIPEKFKYEDVLYTREPMSFFDYTYVDENDKLFEDAFTLESLNDEIEIIEDTPKEDKKIEDKARFQYSQIPSWFDRKELIKAVNENFERHQKALNEIIDKINGDK
jgi:hypothetical protein